MYRIFVFLCIVATALARDSKLHEYMSPDEVQELFGTDHASVPEYKVVPVAHAIHKRSKDHQVVQLTNFEQPMTLYLEPSDGFFAGIKTPIIRAKTDYSTSDNGIAYNIVPGVIHPKQQFYQDHVNLAAVQIKHDPEGNALIDGVIDAYAIRPMPKRLRNQFKRNKRSAQDELLQSNRTVYHPNMKDTHDHIIYKIPMIESLHRSIRSTSRAARKRRPKFNKLPKTIYPQILVTVESTLFNVFKQDVDAAVHYVLSFWNAVDLRYRAFQVPHVRLNIAGIILAEDPNVTPYILKNQLNIPGYKNKIDISAALESKAKFLFPETTYIKKRNTLLLQRLKLKYDAAVTMSTYDMCSIPSECVDNTTAITEYTCENDRHTVKNVCSTLGLAFHKGACAYDFTDSVVEAVGIVEDKGSFSGIIPTAHEVGHLLGASHSKHDEFKCPPEDGFLMSQTLSITRKSFIWSGCSVYSIKNFLERERRAKCLFDKPYTGAKTERILPGNVFSRDEQCDRITQTRACGKNETERVCERLFCVSRYANNLCLRVANTAAAEGSSCAEGHHCINAKCVSKSKESVLLQLGTNDFDLSSEEFYEYDTSTEFDLWEMENQEDTTIKNKDNSEERVDNGNDDRENEITQEKLIESIEDGKTEKNYE